MNTGAVIVKIYDQKQEDGTHPYVAMIYDKEEKNIRIDMCGDLKLDLPAGEASHHHIKLNRKQSVKMIELLEDFILWNPK